jgi:uncharacterized protein YuzE
LKRLAVAASPSGVLDAAPLGSGFQSVAQVSLRTDGIVDKSGKIIGVEAVSATSQASVTKAGTGLDAVAQPSTRTEVPHTTTAQVVDKLAVPVIKASDLVVKESTPGVKIEPSPLAATTIVVRDLSSPVAPAKDTTATTTATTLAAKDASPVTTRVETVATAAASALSNKVEVATASALSNKVEIASSGQSSGFQSVAQVSLRTDGIVDKSGKIIGVEALSATSQASVTKAVTGLDAVAQPSTRAEAAPVITAQVVDKSAVPVIRASDLVVKESTPGVKIEPSPLAATTIVARDLSSPLAPGKDTTATTTTTTTTLAAKDASPVTTRVETVAMAPAPTLSNKVEVATAPALSNKVEVATTPASNNKVEVASSGQSSGFQSVAQVSLRTDGIVDKSGKTISSEALVVAPITAVTKAVFVPSAVTPEATTSKVETVSATSQTSGSKPASGFDSVTQTSTRAEAAPVITAQVVDKSAVPVIKASDLVVKESTPGVKIEPSPLAATTIVARDLSSPVAPGKDTTATTTTTLAAKDASPVTTRVETVATAPTSSALSNKVEVATAPASNNKVEVASSGQSSGFQSVAQVSLRTDGIVDKSGKTISSEALVVTPITAVTKAVFVPSTVTPEATTNKVETVSATSQASGSKPASGFDSVTQTSTRAEAAPVITAQVVDKSAVPVIRASDLVVKESTPGVKIEPSPLAATTIVARDLSSPVAPGKDTTAATTTLAAKDASPVTTRVETVATAPTSSALSNKVEVATAPASNNKVEVASSGQSSGFQSVAQVSLRTDGIVDKSGKTISSEALVVAPTAAVTRAVFVPSTVTPEATTNKVETVSATSQASGSKPASGFDSVTQTSTRTDAAHTTTAQAVDKSAVPVIRASDLVVKESTPGVKIEPSPLAATTIAARDLSSPVAPGKDTTAATTTTALAAKDASPVTTRVETVATAPTSSALSNKVEVATVPASNNKVEVVSSSQSSGFQSVAQVSLRTDGIVDKSGKIIGVEAVSPTSQASGSKPASGFDSVTQTSTRTAPTQQIDATTANKSAVPVIKASDLVVKESTPGVKIEPSPLAATTTVARDLSSPVAPTKDTTTTLAAKDASPVTTRVETAATAPTLGNKVEVVSSSQSSGFQSVAQVSLRTDGIVDKSGKAISSETLVVAPITAVTRATFVPSAVTPEATTNRVETVSATSQASGSKPASGFDSVTQASTRTAPTQQIDATTANKSAVPVIKASDLVVKESTPGVKIEPSPLAATTTVARDLSSPVAPTKDTTTTTTTLAAKDASPVTTRVETAATAPTLGNKVEVASSSQSSGFQSVAQVSLRTDGIVDKSGKAISSETLVVAPITAVTRATFVPSAVTPEATTNRVETVSATSQASGSKPASGFDSVTQASTRTAPTQQIDATTANKSAVPVIKASDLVVKESTPGVKIEPSPLAATTNVARDLSSPVAPSNKVEVVSNTQLAGVHSVTQASLKTDGSVDKTAKQVSTETLAVAPIAAALPISSIAQTSVTPATKDLVTREVSKELVTKSETPQRLFDGLQTAANSTAPKAIAFEHSQNNHFNQPATALSAALAAALNSRMIGQSGQFVEPSKTAESAHITTKPQPPVSSAAGTAAMIDTSTIAATKGNILGIASGAKTESGFGAGTKSEVVAPAKTEALSVNSEIKFPLGSKVKKSETEASTDDATIITATNARAFGTGSNGAGAGAIVGTGTNATNTVNGQVIDPTAAGMIGGTITPKPFDLPPLEITDKENENGRSSKHNGSNNAANNSGNKTKWRPITERNE